MADSKKTNFTYRVNTKTPAEVEEWLATKPDGLSYPEFVNAAIMVARAKEEGSDLDLDTITSSLAEMVNAGVAARPAGGGAVASISADEVASAVKPIVSQDGEATRSHIDEVADRLGQQIEAISESATPSPFDDAFAPESGIRQATQVTPADIDAEEIAQSVSESVTESVSESVAEAVSDAVADAVQEDGEKTRDAVSGLAGSVDKVGEDVASILEALQSSSVPSSVTVEAEIGETDDSPNIVEDGQLGEDDLNFAVQRIKDTMRTDGQKTRNAIIDKIDKIDKSIADQAQEIVDILATKADKDDEPAPQGISSEDMQAIADAIRQSNEMMLEAMDEKIAAIQQAEAQGSRDIVFDEATTSFFKRIHNSVASILIRVDAMQAQLEHIQKIVERSGSTLRTMSRGEAIDDGRSIVSSRSQFGDTSMFSNAPEIEEVDDAALVGMKPWDSRDGGMRGAIPEDAAGDGLFPFAEEPAADDQPAEPAEEPRSMTASTETGVPFGFDTGSSSLMEDIFGKLDEEPKAQTAEDKTEKPEKPERKGPRISVPKRHRGHHVPVAEEEPVAAEEPQEPLDKFGLMQPSASVPTASPSAEPLDSIIDGLDLGNVASVASDPDELLTDALQSLLG